MEYEKKRDIKFQIELLKIQLDMDYRRNWFFTFFAILISLIIAFPFDFVRSGIAPFLVGLTLIFLVLESNWKKKTLSELEKKYLD